MRRFINAYEEVRTAINYLRRKQGDADSKLVCGFDLGANRAMSFDIVDFRFCFP